MAATDFVEKEGSDQGGYDFRRGITDYTKIFVGPWTSRFEFINALINNPSTLEYLTHPIDKTAVPISYRLRGLGETRYTEYEGRPTINYSVAEFTVKYEGKGVTLQGFRINARSIIERTSPANYDYSPGQGGSAVNNEVLYDSYGLEVTIEAPPVPLTDAQVANIVAAVGCVNSVTINSTLYKIFPVSCPANSLLFENFWYEEFIMPFEVGKSVKNFTFIFKYNADLWTKKPIYNESTGQITLVDRSPNPYNRTYDFNNIFAMYLSNINYTPTEWEESADLPEPE